MRKNKFLKSMTVGTLCVNMAIAAVFSPVCTVFAEEASMDDATASESDASTENASEDAAVTLDTTIVTLGADLSDEQRETVLSLLGLTEDELSDCIVLEITNDDEHYYLDDYLSSDVIGKRALSSIRLDKADEGSGISVTTHNINYCTDSMYVNALATAGLEDATVTVAGPFEISGTAALVGTIKAYEQLTGEDVSEDVIDAATDELVTTGELATVIGDSDKAAELMGYIKNQVVANDLSTDDEIRQAVEEAAIEMDIDLSDSTIDKIVDSMKKISKLDLDIDSLAEQAKGLYDKLTGLDLNLDTEQAQGFFNKIANFFKNVYEKIKGLLS